jgi:uncharacterized protein YdaU (DUF1376 family)
VSGRRKQRLPWFKFYATDWLGNTNVFRLTAEQRGMLIQLICHAWQDPNRLLLDDPVFLCNIAGVHCDRFDDLKKVLDLFFEKSGTGYMLAEPFDLARQAADAEESVERQREKGRLSVAARRKEFGTAQPNAGSWSATQASSHGSNSGSDSSGSGSDYGSGFGAGTGADIGDRENCVECGRRGVANDNGRYLCDEHKPDVPWN